MATPEDEMARDFSVTFEGPAFESNRIPVDDVAPSLLALGRLVRQAQIVVAPDGPPVSLEIRATQPGSWDVGLHLASALHQMADLFGSAGATSASNALTITFAYFKLVRWLAGRQITRREPGPSEGTTTVFVENGDNITIENLTINVYDRPDARKASRDFLRPLAAPGAEKVRLERAQQTSDADRVEIDREDFEAFVEGANDDELLIDDRTFSAVIVSVVSASFESRYKWWLDWGDTRIRARIEDAGFLTEISRGQEGFYGGDSLTVDLRRRQWAPSAGRADEWTVVKVHGHEHVASAALPLPLDEEEDDDES